MPGSMGKKGGGVKGTTRKAGASAVSNSRGSRAVNGNKRHGPSGRAGSQLPSSSGGINGPTSRGNG